MTTQQEQFERMMRATSTIWRITGTLDGQEERVVVPFGYSMQREFVLKSDAVGTLECNEEDLLATGYADLRVVSVTTIDFATV